ncbi:MAG: hypothetical protein WEC80_00560, partial [Patescibacteria group bacterium]
MKEAAKINLIIDKNLKNKNYQIFIIRTQKFKENKKYIQEIAATIIDAYNLCKKRDNKSISWFAVISEKVIAVSQGRSFLIKDIKPRLMARILYRFVRKNPFGIGLRSPWTMELAIREAGISKIIYASVLSAITRPFGIKGL